MKNFKNLLSFLTLLAFSFVFLPACNQSPTDITEQIQTANNAFMEAFNSGDAHELAIKYTADGQLFPSNSDVIKGQENIEVFWNGAKEMGVAKAELETTKAEAVGAMAVETGHYKLYAQNDQMIDHGKYVVSWMKVDGKWKLHNDIWNTSVPESPIKGAWNLVEIKNINDGAVTNSFPNGNVQMQQVKIWTDGHFSFTGTYAMNNETSNNYGEGTYSLNGNIYTENIDYHVSEPLIGTSIKMHIEVKGNTLTQIYPVDDSGNYDENNYSIEKYVKLD
ncbi:YybH family protein [Maribellus mangrovi]|uniref:YybH family protein n=1 Tax=Maribellus mangrovi TaxID=3133146 RepID=UPI0030ED8829